MPRQQTLDRFAKHRKVKTIDLKLPDAEGTDSFLRLYTDVWSPCEEEAILDECGKVDYERLTILGGKTNPRVQLKLDEGVPSYQYRNTKQDQLSAGAWVHAIVDRILETTGEKQRPNMALLNKYDPADKIGMHRDEREGLEEGMPIYGASFGEQRYFDVLNVHTNRKIRYDLPRRSLVVMGGAMQDHFKHGIPTQISTSCNTRFSLTFRYIKVR
jgi:alkylated DNA repair dioxygenase AlkB